MKEITRIIEAQVTVIDRMKDDDADMVVMSKKDAEKNAKDALMKMFSADDVQVEIHDFMMDKE